MSLAVEIKKSPMMQQWQKCKAKAKGAILLFQCGDFYEAFYDDAVALSKHLDLTLTKRQDIPMAGAPVGSLDTIIQRLLEKGQIIAIADQTEDAKNAKGLVKREITRIVSPATHMEASLIQRNANNFFACAFQVNQEIGICFLDLSTGEMITLEVNTVAELIGQIAKRHPSELLLCDKFYQSNQAIFDDLNLYAPFRLSLREHWHFDHKNATDILTNHFNISSLDAFGLRGMVSTINAAGGLLLYLTNELLTDISHIKSIAKLDLRSHLSIDYQTSSSLDILSSTSSHKSANLLETLDRTRTAMGCRLFTNWLLYPLLNKDAIQKRQDSVEELIKNHVLLKETLNPIRDIERLVMRIKANVAGPRDLIALAESLKQIPDLFSKIRKLESPLFLEMRNEFIDFSPLEELISLSIVDNPPLRFTDGGIFKQGQIPELDELRAMSDSNRSYLANYQMRLREELDIKTLRVNFNKAFGYFIEVSRMQSAKMPTTFMRRQTLVNAERFISPELKEYEEKILGAQEKIIELEQTKFLELREQVGLHASNLLKLSSQIAQIDVLHSLATIAKEKSYIKPLIHNNDSIEIQDGRHPVVETFLKDGSFIPNNTHLDNDANSLILLTGPNMAGKSTYIRQVALIVIMAQIGSFVPAKSASIGIVDKIFSRIGASDDLARGQSTFMVEMIETANILNNATSKSLVILDEIGRGTSTYDGISIALSVAEHLLHEIKAKTLFATHYFELTMLEQREKGAKNFRVAVQENEDGIVFLHKILKGEADKSYGIHVASLAGLPKSVLFKAQSHLKSLENTKEGKIKKSPPSKGKQMLLFNSDEENLFIEEELKQLDINKLTPFEALQKLVEWKNKL